MKKAEKEYLDRVSRLPCAVCGLFGVQVHHVRRYGERRDNFKVAPLCWLHHVGGFGIHTLGKKEWERIFLTQDELLAKTEAMLK